MTFSTIEFFHSLELQLIHKIAHPWLWEPSTTDSNAPLMAARHLPPQNLPILVPQRTKRSGTEQNNCTVTGPSINKADVFRGPYKKKSKRTLSQKKPQSLLQHASDEGIHNEFRNRSCKHCQCQWRYCRWNPCWNERQSRSSPLSDVEGGKGWLFYRDRMKGKTERENTKPKWKSLFFNGI